MKRLSQLSDLEAVFKIYMEESVIPFLGYDPMPLEQFRSIFEELVSSSSFFVYEINGRVVGFFKVSRHPGRANHVAYVGTLAIDPEFQGKGLAKKIIEELLNELRNQGVKRVELIVESDNPKAIGFYKRLGFEVEGTLKKFYKREGEAQFIDDFLMAKLFD